MDQGWFENYSALIKKRDEHSLRDHVISLAREDFQFNITQSYMMHNLAVNFNAESRLLSVPVFQTVRTYSLLYQLKPTKQRKTDFEFYINGTSERILHELCHYMVGGNNVGKDNYNLPSITKRKPDLLAFYEILASSLHHAWLEIAGLVITCENDETEDIYGEMKELFLKTGHLVKNEGNVSVGIVCSNLGKYFNQFVVS